MSSGKSLFAALLLLAAIAISASVWLTPWIGFVLFFACAVWFAIAVQRQRASVRELLRDPAAVATPFDDAITTLRNRLRESELTIADRDAEIAQRKQITNAVPDGLFLLDRDHRILWCNQSALVMHGLDAFRDIGKPIGQLIRAPEFLAYLEQRSSDAPTIQLGTRTLAIRVENAVDGTRLLLTRDVTERERLDRMRRDFVANVSHEMRTPLTVVAGYVETLRDLPLEESDRGKYLETVATQTENMRRLVEDLLILARLENEQVPLEQTTIDLHQLASETLRDAVALSNGRHQFSSTFDRASVVGSYNELRSAVGNLLSNAVRYTPRDGRIAIELSADNEHAVIAVTDTGVGIAPEHIPRLTERFYRVDRSRSRETGGTGLGLAIVKHIAQRHGGALEIESTLGKGSTFRLRFPNAQ
jgi:two-component system, OmpR family, phosphate regulon sensor histidine kinase PhoR